MATCSIRSCNEAAIAGFAELIEVGSISFPRRMVSVGTRYWCRRHECLSLELQGKLGQAIELMETVIPARLSAGEEDRRGLSEIQEDAISTQEARHTEGSRGRSETTGGKKPVAGEKRRRKRFPVDGPAEVVVADAGIVFRGKTHDLSQTGCYINSKGYLVAGIGAEVEVRFSVSDVQFRAPAKVRLVKPGKGAGFEFLRVEQNVQKDLDTLIETLSCATPAPPELPAEVSFADSR
jgi:hypothetical protein